MIKEKTTIILDRYLLKYVFQISLWAELIYNYRVDVSDVIDRRETIIIAYYRTRIIRYNT